MARRAMSESRRLTGLLKIMRKEDLAPKEHIEKLREELNIMHKTKQFSECNTMGELTASHIQYMLDLKEVKW